MLSHTALKRLTKEEEMIQKFIDDEGKMFRAYPSTRHDTSTKNYKIWDIYFTLDEDSLYSGVVLKAVMEFPDCYPLQPPTLRFVTEMFHPNIYKDGKVCISILEEDTHDPTGYTKSEDKWTPVQNIRTILLSIVVVINSPNTESPANVDASVMFRKDLEKYRVKVKRLVQDGHKKLLEIDSRVREMETSRLHDKYTGG